jgi:hypothetical protein
MRTVSIVRACLLLASLNVWAVSAQGATPPPPSSGGDAEAQKLVTAAMEVDYLKMSFDAAKKKLSQAALTCRRKGCSTGLHASVHGYFAIIHWLGEDARELALEDLKNMLKIDLEQKLDVRYSNEEIEEEWEAKQSEMRKVVSEERRVAAAREAEERKAQAARDAEDRRLAAIKAAEEAKRAEEEKKAAALKAEADRKEAARKAEEDKKAAAAKALEERRAAAARQAELNKQQAIKDAEDKLARDAAKHADEQKHATEAQKAEAWRRLTEEKKELQRKAEEDRKRVEEDRKEAARRAIDEKKDAARRAEEDKKRAEEDKRDAARRAADEKKEAAARAAEEAKRAADEKREAARKAEEEKKAVALKTAEDAKKAAEEKKEAARKAEEERKEAARKAEEERKEAARKAEEEKKEAALKAIEDAKRAAEEKREAARKAIEEKKEAALRAAEEAKKAADEKKEAARKAAEDAKKADEERRLRVPPPVGKLVENPFKEQAVGYPIPILVKIPPAPPKIEKPRVEVVKVVAEYTAPGFESPRQVELKPEKEGAWVGELPCDVTAKDGEVTYSIAAFNKFDNAVARSGSNTKPNKVAVKSELVSSLPHWPGELPPESCAAIQSKAKAAAQAKCATSEQGCNTAPPPLCEGNECGNDEVPAALAANQPKRFGCVSCRVGSDVSDPEWVPAGWLALGLGLAYRSVARRRRDRRP